MAGCMAQSLAPVRLLRCAVYNPCSTVKGLRSDLISNELSKLDVVILTGTRQRARGGGQAITWSRYSHRGYQFGYIPSPYMARACGGIIFLGPPQIPKAKDQVEASGTIWHGGQNGRHQSCWEKRTSCLASPTSPQSP